MRREAFIEAQQIPTDVKTVAPVTEQQKAFIAAISEDSASEPNGDDISDILSLALNLCEHGILNGHRIDTTLLEKIMWKRHQLSLESLGQSTVKELLSARRIAVSGTSFLCPDDFPAWRNAYDTIVQGGAQTDSIG